MIEFEIKESVDLNGISSAFIDESSFLIKVG